MRDYAIACIAGSAINVMAGAMLLAVYNNSLGYLGLASGVVMMSIGFFVNVIQEKI